MPLSSQTRSIALTLARAERSARLGRPHEPLDGLRAEFQFRRAVDDLGRITVPLSARHVSQLRSVVDSKGAAR